MPRTPPETFCGVPFAGDRGDRAERHVFPTAGKAAVLVVGSRHRQTELLYRMPPIALEEPLAQLREQVRTEALNQPGIYRMLGGGGVVLYVGKSKQIRTRLLGYFRARAREKAWKIVRDARSIEWEYVPSEFASLLRELDLIKRYRPPYNVHQKRDRIYSFLKLTVGPAPRLHVVRRVTGEAGIFFGPFQGGQRIVEAVRELNDVLELRDCRSSTPIHFSDQDDLFGSDRSPLCARVELRRCLGPCAGGCSAAEYASRVQQARAFLRGDGNGPIEMLTRRMDAAAANWKFEYAALLRTRLERLEMLRMEFQRLKESTDGLTFLYAVPGVGGDHRVYAIRSGSIRAVFPAPRTARQRLSLLSEAGEHYQRPEGVTEISTPRRVDELLLVSHWFRIRPMEMARTYAPDMWKKLPLTSDLDREIATLPKRRKAPVKATGITVAPPPL